LTVTTDAALAFYSRHGAALFPIPAGQKDPTGIVGSFKQDCSRDPAAWQAWRAANPNCNFGVVGFASQWVIVDIDTKGEAKPGETIAQAASRNRDEAWSLWVDLCSQWQAPVAMPQVESARGGWHVYFALPADMDATRLRQPDAIKGRINIRVRGYTVAAGSYYDGTAKGEASGHYSLINDAPPHPAPAALLEHIKPAAPRDRAAVRTGDRDANDVAGLVTWLTEHDAFDDYESWFQLGMALRLEFGDAGLPLWEIATWPEALDSLPEKWESFASEPTADSVTLNTFLDRAHRAGWRGTVRKSTAAMFGGADAVAAIAAAAGATLSGPGGMSMLQGQETQANICRPILADFLASSADMWQRPREMDLCPRLPPEMQGHPLFAQLTDTIHRVVAFAESDAFKAERVRDVLGVLLSLHKDTGEAVIRRIRNCGKRPPEREARAKANAIDEETHHSCISTDNWIRDDKGIEHDNPDNVVVLLAITGLELRYNAWIERIEVRGGTGDLAFPDWSRLEDAIVARLMTRAKRTGTRFRPGKDFLWDSIIAEAHRNTFDPALELLDALAAAWDGVPRLASWLSTVCHTPADAYHQAVGINIVGGMVRRMRHPGCKHDTMAVFFGPQGTGKSTMAKLLAGPDDWFTDVVQLGDAAKDLIQSLAGKCVVEIGEMGMRSNATAAHVKAMISRQVDSGRTAYARSVTDRPRRNIFIGTANEDEPLQDPTGNRRFLPVRVESHVDLEWLAANAAQLVGEAARLEAAGTCFDLPREVWAVAAEHQEAARAVSDVEILLNEWFAETPYTANAYVAAADLATLAQLAGWRNSQGGRTQFMKRLGFTSELVALNGKKTRVWLRASGTVRNTSGAVRGAVRYVVSTDQAGRPQVTIRQEAVAPGGAAPVPPPPRT
jgi:hypothetical protein